MSNETSTIKEEFKHFVSYFKYQKKTNSILTKPIGHRAVMSNLDFEHSYSRFSVVILEDLKYTNTLILTIFMCCCAFILFWAV